MRQIEVDNIVAEPDRRVKDGGYTILEMSREAEKE